MLLFSILDTHLDIFGFCVKRTGQCDRSDIPSHWSRSVERDLLNNCYPLYSFASIFKVHTWYINSSVLLLQDITHMINYKKNYARSSHPSHNLTLPLLPSTQQLPPHTASELHQKFSQPIIVVLDLCLPLTSREALWFVQWHLASPSTDHCTNIWKIKNIRHFFFIIQI